MYGAVLCGNRTRDHTEEQAGRAVVIMVNWTSELLKQIAYFNHIKANVGAWDAARIRSRTIAARLGLCDATLVTLRHLLLTHPVDARPFSTDLDVFKQVLRDQQYSNAVELAPRVIVDCGANVGYTSAYFLSRFPSARVIAIEPFPSNVEMCRRNLAPYGDRVTLHAAAIWSKRCNLAFDHETIKDEWSVMVRPAGPGDGETIAAIDIPSLGLACIDLLKVDIERAEIELFGPSSAAWLPTVSNIIIELHDQACEDIFFAALDRYTYTLSRSGELTVCRDLRLRSCPAG
jgi:FkbM family methyltransferase